MANDLNFNIINELVNSVLADKPELFLIQLKITPTHQIKVFIDSDEGVSIDSCTKVNRRLYNAIEEAGIFPEGDFSLEVSSPGIGEPILLTRQYQKNVGRYLVVTKTDELKIEGKLLDSTTEGIVIEETKGKGKKMIVQTHSILFEDIKMAVVEVKF